MTKLSARRLRLLQNGHPWICLLSTLKRIDGFQDHHPLEINVSALPLDTLNSISLIRKQVKTNYPNIALRLTTPEKPISPAEIQVSLSYLHILR